MVALSLSSAWTRELDCVLRKSLAHTKLVQTNVIWNLYQNKWKGVGGNRQPGLLWSAKGKPGDEYSRTVTVSTFTDTNPYNILLMSSKTRQTMPALETWAIKTWREKRAECWTQNWLTHDLHLCCQHVFQGCKVICGYFIIYVRSHRFWQLDGSLAILYSTNTLTCRHWNRLASPLYQHIQGVCFYNSGIQPRNPCLCLPVRCL